MSRTRLAVVAAVVLLACDPCMPAERPKPDTERVITLRARDAELRGESLKYTAAMPHNSIGYWGDPKDSVAWPVPNGAAGEYHVLITYSCDPAAAGSAYDVSVADQVLNCRSLSTGSWYNYLHHNLGKIRLVAGDKHLVVQPRAEPKWKAIGIRMIRLVPADIDPEPLLTIKPMPVYVVPNFHPGCMGWLAEYTVERNYCLGSYLTHLDRVASDANYNFALSEIPHVITMMELEPKRFEQLRRRVEEGRVEMVNAFVLEPTICLSGGEALVKQGVEGLRWYEQVMGVRPRFSWMIDVTGQHEQMGQITEGLGLDALVYCRYNPTGSLIHWVESPDGTRSVAFGMGHYAGWGEVFRTTAPLTEAQVRTLVQNARARQGQTPEGAPVLVLGGHGDYSTAPALEEYPSQFLKQWKQIEPKRELRFSTFGQYADQVLPGIRSGEIDLPVLRSGTAYGWCAFWVQNPRTKQSYRRTEHSVQAAEMLATAASLTAGTEYPAQEMANAWMLLALNMDRAVLWGCGVAGVFEDDKSWDVRDRYASANAAAETTQRTALRALAGNGSATALFNPLNWPRRDAVAVTLPEGMRPADVESQVLEDGRTTLVRAKLSSVGLASMKLKPGQSAPKEIALPKTIEMEHYLARIDPDSGALVNVKRKPSGRDVLSGPANVIVALRGTDAHNLPVRAQMAVLDSSSSARPDISVLEGPLAMIVTARSTFHGGGELRRVVRFFRHQRRIDFHTELVDVPDETAVLAEFPLAEEITEVRRGIPFGFSHGAWSKPNPKLTGPTRGIMPAIRFSHYEQSGGGGVAILDRGVPGRELRGNIALLYLTNTADQYYGVATNWLSGKGRQTFDYSLVWHEGDWATARIPQKAWEFNSPPVVLHQTGETEAHSLLSTSDNVIVQAVRREGRQIEIRLAECLGLAAGAEITVRLPHTDAALTDLLGERPLKIDGRGTYRLKLRPQQIVTLRLQTSQAVSPIKALTSWNSIVPPAKRDYLQSFRRPELIGHPKPTP